MQSVLITGASTGIGRAAALWQDRAGWQVFAGVRKEADAESLRAEGSDRLIPIIIDVTQPEQVAAARAQIEEAVGENGLTGLVNNAGIADGGPVEFLDLDDVRRLFEVNLYGALRCTQTFLPLLRQGEPGRVINVSSIGGLWSGPFTAPYNASKWALEAFSDSLRMELHSQGIYVSVVEPGTIKTEIWAKGETRRSSFEVALPEDVERVYGDELRSFAGVLKKQPDQGVHPDVVAKVIDHALSARRPRTRYLVGPDAKLIATIRWLLPDRLFDWVIRTALASR